MSQVQQSLMLWATKIAGVGVNVSARAQPSNAKDLEVSLVLLEYATAPPSHTHQQAPLSVMCKFLVFAHGSDALQVQALMERLLFSAMETKELEDGTVFDLDLGSPDVALWQSLALTVRPSFWIHVVQRKPRDIKPAPLVTEGIQLHVMPNASLSGVVVTARGLPLPGAVVSYPSSNKSTQTDEKGHFVFKAISSKNKQAELVITYKQYSMKSKVNLSQSPVKVIFRHKEL